MYAVIVIQKPAGSKEWRLYQCAGILDTQEKAEALGASQLVAFKSPSYRVVIAPLQYEVKLTAPPMETISFKP